jgi:hypothetical protein
MSASTLTEGAYTPALSKACDLADRDANNAMRKKGNNSNRCLTAFTGVVCRALIFGHCGFLRSVSEVGD